MLADDFEAEFKQLEHETQLDPVELDILRVLNDENVSMRAGEISMHLDVTYQLVGRRTGKLQELALVEKKRDQTDNHNRSKLTDRARTTYFA